MLLKLTKLEKRGIKGNSTRVLSVVCSFSSPLRTSISRGGHLAANTIIDVLGFIQPNEKDVKWI